MVLNKTGIIKMYKKIKIIQQPLCWLSISDYNPLFRKCYGRRGRQISKWHTRPPYWAFCLRAVRRERTMKWQLFEHSACFVAMETWLACEFRKAKLLGGPVNWESNHAYLGNPQSASRVSIDRGDVRSLTDQHVFVNCCSGNNTN